VIVARGRSGGGPLIPRANGCASALFRTTKGPLGEKGCGLARLWLALLVRGLRFPATGALSRG
jgi:hypothetical protein